jgi:hypothetical protein
MISQFCMKSSIDWVMKVAEIIRAGHSLIYSRFAIRSPLNFFPWIADAHAFIFWISWTEPHCTLTEPRPILNWATSHPSTEPRLILQLSQASPCTDSCHTLAEPHHMMKWATLQPELSHATPWTESRRTLNWVTPHPHWAMLHTINWATPHPHLSNAAPFNWATPNPVLSQAAP